LDYVDSETAVARKRVEHAERAILLEQEDLTNAEKAGFTTTKPEPTTEEMLNAIGNSLSDLASSDNVEDGAEEDDDEKDPEVGKLSGDDEPGWVMGTISKSVQHGMECFRQMQMKIEELTQPRRGEVANYLRDRHKKYEMTDMMVPAVIQLQKQDDGASSSRSTFGDSMQTLHTVPRKSEMRHMTS